MTDALQSWRREHADHARLLSLFERELAVFRRDDAPDTGTMCDVMHYLLQHAERHHHLPETQLYDRLAERNPSLGLLVQRLYQEHRVLTAVGGELLERLEGLAADTITSREQIIASGETFVTYFRHHLTVEERDLLPHATQLTAQDREALSKAHDGVPDPLFGDPPEPRFLDLRRRLTSSIE